MFDIAGMRKIVVILMMSLYSMGNVLFPGTDLAHLQDMYESCEMEDPDINVADFIFEHLLNIPEISDDREESNGKPHQPTHIVSQAPAVAIIARPYIIEGRHQTFAEDGSVFNGFTQLHFSRFFSTRMLRPPIA